MKVTTKLAAGAVVLVAGFALWTSTVRDPDQPRRAAITCWWDPEGATARVSYRFGDAHEFIPGVGGSEANGKLDTVNGATKEVPFFRTGAVKVGERVQVSISWPDQRLHNATCVLKAGINVSTVPKTAQRVYTAWILAV